MIAAKSFSPHSEWLPPKNFSFMTPTICISKVAGLIDKFAIELLAYFSKSAIFFS
mgnify:CR=1 FL=1